MHEQLTLFPDSLFGYAIEKCSFKCSKPTVMYQFSPGGWAFVHVDGYPAHSWEPKVYKRKWYQLWEPKERVNVRWVEKVFVPPYR